MKLFYILLAGILTFGTACLTAQEKPTPTVGYNLAGCKSGSFGVYHADVANGKFIINWHLVAPGVIEKYADKDQAVMEYSAEPADADGDIVFHTKMISETSGRTVEIRGVIHGKYIVGAALSNGELTVAFYGKEGIPDDIAKEHIGAEDDVDFQSCVEMQGHAAAEVPGILGKWLHDHIAGKNQNQKGGNSSASR